ncbi:glycoside hydrolase family 3 N-terminal domain-containing protein [Defluviimonas aestuarii]|uniref:glycoside hydrolase family 3 N-terminal domain-containing protein n=1 Tax=Albidovulum aestuarii TaxID=1130726 RepID=UPI00249CDE40|nr:glycoside hydrolase family 3 N-terminal domain-containing protein [Defluviimonas aestuarii]MDI3337426.1 glycoside hydrolase family 3 N-terminal domain-containing protein [Defluviimonas aestuarii]
MRTHSGALMTSAASATILGPSGPVLNADEAAFYRDADPWGFILFARNVETPDQLRRLTGDLRAAVGRDAPVLVDQEGGRVQRLRAPHWREYLPPLVQMARTMPGDHARAVWLRYRLIAAELREVGIDANCAPTADIAGADTHPFLRNRCFGSDPATVTLAARATADGLLAGGVLPVMKHLPGHGRAVVDSHLHLPRVAAPLEELDAADFAPFMELTDLPMAMTAHIVFDAVDPDRPATASPAAVRLIRERIGFDGLLMTDDLSMEALSGTLSDRAAAGIAAGCDIALYCKGVREEAEAVVAAAGRMSDAASRRAEAALAARITPDAIDTALLEAEFEALLKGQADG